jgi:hypothetical protein
MNTTSTMITDSAGSQCWRNSAGQLHRLDGPAMEFMGGNSYWYHMGLMHRIGGPAVKNITTGKCYWWIHGVQYTEAEYLMITFLSHE